MKTAFKWTTLWFFVALIALYATLFSLTEFNASDFKTHLLAIPGVLAIHAIGGAIALVLGLIQFQRIAKFLPAKSHRYLGRIYAVAVLVSGVAGLLMALRSEAGVLAQTGFGLLALSWLVTLVWAWRAIRQRDRATHEWFMRLNYALTFAAVTLRLEMPFLSLLLGFETGYVIVAWLCWLPNLLFVALTQRKPQRVAAS